MLRPPSFLLCLALLLLLGGGCQLPPGNRSAGEGRENPSAELTYRAKGVLYKDLKAYTSFTKAQIHSFDVSPDESQLVLSLWREGHWQIFLTSLKSSGRLIQLTPADNGDYVQPRFDPTGKRIVFVIHSRGHWQIAFLSLSSPGLIFPLTSEKKALIACPTWDGAGERVAYSIPSQKGRWELWVYDLSQHTQSLLGEGFCPEWSWKGGEEIYQTKMNFQSQKAPHPNPPPKRGREKTENPMLLGIAYLQEDTSGQINLWEIDPEGRRRSRLASTPGKSVIFPSWSSHENRLAFLQTPARLLDSSTSRLLTVDRRLSTVDSSYVKGEIWQKILEGKNPSSELPIVQEPLWIRQIVARNTHLYFLTFKEGTENIWGLIPLSWK